MQVRLTVDVPDIVGEVLLKGLRESRTVDICPDAHFPGWTGRIVRADKEVLVPDDDEEPDVDLDNKRRREDTL